ncbi:MAG: hypothetical protein IJU19_04470, partial [Bacteroidales bacterium]|nr:hypothetical protein [Bacteroidales bacterium]
ATQVFYLDFVGHHKGEFLCKDSGFIQIVGGKNQAARRPELLNFHKSRRYNGSHFCHFLPFGNYQTRRKSLC